MSSVWPVADDPRAKLFNEFDTSRKAMKIFYVILGVAGSPFPVDIEPSETVGDLTKAIKKENKSRFKHVDAYDLQLYLAKKDKGNGAWLTENDVATVHDDAVAETYKLMKPTLFLNNTEICGESINQCDVHVLVKVPVRLPTIHQLRYRHFTVGSVDIRTTERMIFDPPALVHFWRALQGDSAEFKADAVITLPEGTFLLGNPMLGSRIYIRHCYPRLWQVCSNIIHDKAKNTPHLVILGNPGIGKTYFGYVILWLLARSGTTVVYESGASGQRFLFSQDVVVEGSQQDFIDILKQTTAYYIVDAIEPRYFPAKTILLTSPRRKVWYEFNKDDCETRHLPVWSRDEILNCRELMYSDIPASVVEDCFRRWGGIPRYVLHYATASDQQLWLEKAMENVKLNWLMEACGKLYENPSEESLHLLHYRVTKDFNTVYFDFASQYVLEGIYRRLYNRNKQKLLELIDYSGWVGAAAVLRDHLFEGYVHSVLPRGGTFEIRLLVDDSEAQDDDTRNGGDVFTGGFWSEDRLMEDWESPDDDDSSGEDQVSGDVSDSVIPDIASIGTDVTAITLPERRRVVFDSANGLEAGDPSSYLQPVVKNYQSVDAIMKPNVMFQVTCSNEHHCKQAGLYDVLKLLKNPAAPALIFVLPPDRFLSFGYQKYHNSKGEAVEESKYLNVRKIRQFAMEVKPSVKADDDTC